MNVSATKVYQKSKQKDSTYLLIRLKYKHFRKISLKLPDPVLTHIIVHIAMQLCWIFYPYRDRIVSQYYAHINSPTKLKRNPVRVFLHLLCHPPRTRIPFQSREALVGSPISRLCSMISIKQHIMSSAAITLQCTQTAM